MKISQYACDTYTQTVDYRSPNFIGSKPVVWNRSVLMVEWPIGEFKLSNKNIFYSWLIQIFPTSPTDVFHRRRKNEWNVQRTRVRVVRIPGSWTRIKISQISSWRMEVQSCLSRILRSCLGDTSVTPSAISEELCVQSNRCNISSRSLEDSVIIMNCCIVVICLIWRCRKLNVKGMRQLYKASDGWTHWTVACAWVLMMIDEAKFWVVKSWLNKLHVICLCHVTNEAKSCCENKQDTCLQTLEFTTTLRQCNWWIVNGDSSYNPGEHKILCNTEIHLIAKEHCYTFHTTGMKWY